MKLFNYRLMLTHSRLEAEIQCELKRRNPDTWRLLRLKKLRLSIKDRMHRLIGARHPEVA